ncbi:Uncharacterized metallophosphoesterase Cj0846 [Janthinobacterium lividum]|nr:Uncharacterized metallophosphoesterase Cj0846 [Janthinobacterium lividum]
MTTRTPLLRITMILGALHALLGWLLLPSLPVGLAGWLLGGLVLLASTMLMPMTIFARAVTNDARLADRLSWAGSLCMGFFSSLFVLAVLRELTLLIPAARQHAQASAIAVLVLALLATVVGFINARRVARVREVTVPIAGLPAALQGLTIVQLSDIHVGATIKRAYVQAIVARTNGLQPDIIAITGDVVDGTVAQLGSHTAPLGELRARHGVFLVTGNHEYYSGAAPWVAEFRRLGLRVLMNEHAVLEHDGARLALAGVTDFNAAAFDPAQKSDPQAAIAGAPADIPASCWRTSRAARPRRKRPATTCNCRAIRTAASSGHGICSCRCSSPTWRACTGKAGCGFMSAAAPVTGVRRNASARRRRLRYSGWWRRST